MRCFITILLIVGIATNSFPQNPKGKKRTFVLTHATIETVAKGILNNTTLVIRDGKIISLGSGDVPAGAEVIDCTGLYIYPGFIDGGTRLGLSEVGSDPRTQDYNEVGLFVPQVKALTAVNPNSVMIPVARVNGVTAALVSPNNGLFCGEAALINLHGYTSEQMYAGFKGIVLEFPSSGRKGSGDKRSDDEIKKAAEKSMKQLNEVWQKAIQYYKIDSATSGKGVAYYPEFEALLPVVKSEQFLLIEVNAACDIKAAIDWVEEKELKKVILTGVSEGWRVADEIAKAGLPVITGPVMALPSRNYDGYDKPYENASIMKKAGVKVALRTNEIENVRNLPYHAGFAAAYGLGKEEALKAITIVPAEIFGVSDKLGSIEIGKQATMFVADGDPFETKTQIKYLFIDGWQIPLVSRQSELYDEFLHREPGLKK